MSHLYPWFKHKFSDRVLASVREQIIQIFDENSTVLDMGCGTGDLLIRAAPKIKSGLGIDLNKSLVNFANQTKEKKKISNINFLHQDIHQANDIFAHFNNLTCTLFLHSLPFEEGIYFLSTVAQSGIRLIVCDYERPNRLVGKLSVELDELISGHYKHFYIYRNKGGLKSMAKAANIKIIHKEKTSIDGLYLTVLEGICE